MASKKKARRRRGAKPTPAAAKPPAGERARAALANEAPPVEEPGEPVPRGEPISPTQRTALGALTLILLVTVSYLPAML